MHRTLRNALRVFHPRKAITVSAVIILSYAALMLYHASLAQTWFDDTTLAVWVFDVGQGDAIFIDGSKMQVLIDGGPNDAVLEKLGEILPPWDRTINVVIATHPHADHVTGLNAVFARYSVGDIVDDGLLYGAPAAQAFDAVARHGDVARAGESWDLGDGATLTVVWPARALSGSFTDDVNDGSIVALLTYGDTNMLLTGDAGVLQEAGFDVNLPHVDILKVGHHGSDTSTGEELIQKITPDYAVISVGAHNPYHHPSPFVVGRLERDHVTVLRTDRDGDIRVTSTGGEPTVATLHL